MNKTMKQIIKIADKEKIEIVSITPIFKDMAEMEIFLTLFRESSNNYDLEIDIVYLVFDENGNNILIPLFEGEILEDLILKVDPKNISYMLEMYNKLEDDEEIEIDTQLYN